MASRNPVVRAVASAASHLWFPLTFALARHLPRQAMSRGAFWAARLYYRLRPKYLRAARANVSRILGLPESDRSVARIAEAMVTNHFAVWLDFLHFASRSPERAARLVESVEGYSNILEARGIGRGVILLTAHLGNWEVGGLMLAEMREPLSVVLVPDIFPGVERARRRVHERAGVREIPVGSGFAPTLAIMRALEKNGIVAMQGDRDFNNTGLAIDFFGREAYFPRGPFRMAMATGATMLPSFIVRVPDGRYRAIIEGPLPIDRDGDREAALRRNIERYVAVLERYVRQYPDQWYCFYPFWEDPSRTAAP
jgi:KDO2-lipid IV(A) lauroyltransferase